MDVVDEIKDIIQKVNKYFGIISYHVNINQNDITINYKYNGYFYPNSFIKMMMDLLNSKIYKYKDYYWYFKPNNKIDYEYLDGITYIRLHVNVVISETVESYLNLLPLEIINIIASKITNVDIANFCNYMKTWDFCDEDLYKYLYMENFHNFYQLITPYIHLEKNNWYYRYTHLLWEEIKTFEQLDMKYKRIVPRSEHIYFILILYKLLLQEPVDINYVTGIIRKYPELSSYLFKHMNNDRLNKLLSYNNIKNLITTS